jgi:hypothetical protein
VPHDARITHPALSPIPARHAQTGPAPAVGEGIGALPAVASATGPPVSDRRPISPSPTLTASSATPRLRPARHAACRWEGGISTLHSYRPNSVSVGVAYRPSLPLQARLPPHHDHPRVHPRLHPPSRHPFASIVASMTPPLPQTRPRPHHDPRVTHPRLRPRRPSACALAHTSKSRRPQRTMRGRWRATPR